MSGLDKTIVGEAHARSVKAPSVGFCDITTSGTTEYLDLSTWVGSYICITVETEDHYISFGTATGFTMDEDAATLGTANVAFPVTVGEKYHCVVQPTRPWLGYNSISGSAGTIRVHRS